MPKLQYWKAKCLDDRDSYSIRSRTRTEARLRRIHNGESRFAEPTKVIITYTDAFDLMRKLLGEGGVEP
jgi:hypothetical protein